MVSKKLMDLVVLCLNSIVNNLMFGDLNQLIDVRMCPLWQVHNSFSKILLNSVAFQDALVAEYHKVI